MSSDDDLNNFDNDDAYLGVDLDFFSGKTILDCDVLITTHDLKVFKSFARNSGIPVYFQTSKITPEHFSMIQNNNGNPFSFVVLHIVVDMGDASVFMEILDNCGFPHLSADIERVVAGFNNPDEQ